MTRAGLFLCHPEGAKRFEGTLARGWRKSSLGSGLTPSARDDTEGGRSRAEGQPLRSG